jgi:hypothetical protein
MADRPIRAVRRSNQTLPARKKRRIPEASMNWGYVAARQDTHAAGVFKVVIRPAADAGPLVV